ncbi:MAG: peptide ABC transporter substrate-binding protein [Armatimonadetes bacterium CG_4_10_14_3_um_filter_66_18]|nr:ATP-binding cassette domain-containing protein [Armatimonadota bacterium]OIP11304.1 MAG: peptide ABC transporter substrate-binding protein [Armatimonadetes bacterium CG2_30_66_41]PIU92874.1 MAG: peptide ABC transporter substrate-binding protein [Armatimonadetes bacterium CG06_land_8_20_14_3_00_66_21]PIX41982.1 MAG: peptide ABC transporter substrate-binding protein [Armatimonadetes bacterium CG_4_8_14_3_um_filter_66_20]PIY48600.1 MAG: peptide ABC transporter substrate-binding protein [Armatim
MTPSTPPLLSVRDLRTWYPVRHGVFQRVANHVKAVDCVSFDLPVRKTLALVGESGCGKTTVGKSILRLVQPTSGIVRYADKELTALPQADLRPLRRELQIVFQDPYSSLNPRQTVRDIVREGLDAHGLGTKRERDERATEMVCRVGLPKDAMGRYPHEFSGGQRQRIGIARALAVRPNFVVCDEPLSALDASIQAQILNLLRELQEDFGLTYLFITHDLSVVEYLADEVAVMYLGKIVERAPAGELFDAPLHPYTKVLMSAVPRLRPRDRVDRVVLQGDVPSPIHPPSGCSFHPRCPVAEPQCARQEPDLAELAPGRFVKCLVAQREAGAGA